MTTLTFILGMERFNAHVWHQVEQSLATEGVKVRLLRFNDDHIERRDPALVAAIAEADALFVTLVNMRQQADWLTEIIEAHQPRTVFAFESMPEVMALNRVGDYRVKGGKGSMPKPMQMLLRLITRGRDEDTLYAYTKLSKITSKLLPLMPAKLGDFRTWLTVNLYWNQPDAHNLTQMVRLILRDCVGQKLEVAAVRLIPMMGCFHPASKEFFADPPAYLRWAQKQQRFRKGQPLVALLAFRKHVVQEQAYLGELITTLEAEGLAVLPIFVSGIEAHVAVREWIVRQPVDLLLSTMGFPIVGGPAGSTKPGFYHDKASDLLASLDVPYMVAQPLQMQSEEQWREHGVAPMQAVIMYDLPEMDGSIAPVALGAIRDQRIVAASDRLQRAARQAANWVRLRRKPPAERRVALVLYNYPPGLGKLGTAALLDVPATLHALLRRLAVEGYRVAPLPATPETLAQRLATLENGFGGNGDGNHVALPLRTYHRIIPDKQAERVEDYWGSPPGDIAPMGGEAIRLDGFALGNIFVGVQPPMGIPGDPMRLLFDRTFTPHHQFVAFYRWLTEVWGADAIVHVGMHGTAEWMPGLQLGLTADCWSDLLLGEVPNLYLYPMNNPTEAAIARRRGYASIISHAVPPYARAGLYKQLAQARTMLEDEGSDISLPALHALVPDLPPQDDELPEQYLLRLRAYLDELEHRLIVDGLHVFGQAPEPARALALVEAVLDVSRDGKAGLSALLIAAGVQSNRLPTLRRQLVQRLVLGREKGARVWQEVVGGAVPPELELLIAQGHALLKGVSAGEGEMDALIHALAGGYVRPLAGADPIRAGAAAFPTGRNIHGIDPWRLPTESALARGQAMAEALLERHSAAHQGTTPQTVAMTLWAIDTVKTEGESLGAVLTLVGARPERDGQGKIWRYDLIPLEELGRPRVDVLLDISPIFRDTFGMSLDLLDDLFRRAAATDEPLAQNPIRAHTLHWQREGMTWEQATARIFTQAPGHYGTGVDELIEESQWESNEELTSIYLHRGAHTYGGKRAGAAAPETLRGLLGTVEHVFQAIDSVEYGLSDMQHYYGHSGALQLAASQRRGKSVPLTYAESYTGSIKIAAAADLLQIEVRTKLLNPRWYEGLLAHGYAGAAEIGNRFTYLLGWSAVSNIVDPRLFDAAAATFVLDDEMRQRLERANPKAAHNAVARLLEANGRGFWPTDEATLARLHELYGDLEDQLEGVASK